MEIKKGKEKEYKDWYNKNDDLYGRSCFTFAERWADMMEESISKGNTLQAIAKDLSHKSGKEDITGFMYGMAVKILYNSWIYGDELRIWHNLNIQIGNEGIEANKKETVLNPALLSIGV